MASLKHSMFSAIDSAFSPGRSKHSDKASKVDTKEHIYSYRQYNNLKDLASNFSGFCKERGIKKMGKLSPDVAKNFLETKRKEGVSEQTIKVYRSELDKIGICMSNFYNRNINLKVEKLKPREQQKDLEKIRTIAVSDKDYQRLIASKTRLSESKMGVILSRNFGLRVSEVCKLRPCDVSERGIQIIQSKGGRDRYIPARTQEQKDVIRMLKSNFGTGSPTEKYFKTKPNSMNRWFQKGMERLGINQYKDHKTGFHSLRKAYATEYYTSLRKEGKSHREAWDTVSQDLGHGTGREDLFRVYVVK